MRFPRLQRYETLLRRGGLFLLCLGGYFLLRLVPVVGQGIQAVEHGVVVLGTTTGNALARVFRTEGSPEDRLAACEENLRAATARESELRQTARNLEEMEALLGYMRATGSPGVAARITSRSLPEDGTIKIDKGAADGIAVGSGVVIADGHLFGTVTSVAASTAIVELIQSKHSRIPATILGRSRTMGLVEGQGGSLLAMHYIPSDAIIAENDVVVTSGLEGSLPANIVLGVVTTIVRNETTPFIEALVEPLYDSREWTNVLVLPAL